MRWLNHLLAILLVLFAVPVAADAQSANARIVQHFRAYQSALEQGDLAAAEREANSAYEISVAANGDGTPTAALAYNLATVRLDQDRTQDALAPAQRAHAIATVQGAASGVDPVLASLVLGQIELMTRNSAGRARVQNALAAPPAPAHADRAYDAALTLAVSRFQADAYSDAAVAYAHAVRWAGEGNEPTRVFRRANALVGQGAALMNVGRERVEAYGLFHRALADLAPTVQDPGEETITRAMALYYRALAWKTLAHAIMVSSDTRFEQLDNPGTAAEMPCVRLLPEPRPEYPIVRNSYIPAAVIVRLRTDAEARIVDRRVIAAVPLEQFGESVAEVMPMWQVEPLRDRVCPRNGAIAVVIPFAIR